jgi:hypothetical protein
MTSVIFGDVIPVKLDNISYQSVSDHTCSGEHNHTKCEVHERKKNTEKQIKRNPASFLVDNRQSEHKPHRNLLQTYALVL